MEELLQNKGFSLNTYPKCIFYYDCNPFDVETDDFMKCMEKI